MSIGRRYPPQRLIVLNTTTNEPLLEISGNFSVSFDREKVFSIYVPQESGPSLKYWIDLGKAPLVIVIEYLNVGDVDPYQCEISYPSITSRRTK